MEYVFGLIGVGIGVVSTLVAVSFLLRGSEREGYAEAMARFFFDGRTVYQIQDEAVARDDKFGTGMARAAGELGRLVRDAQRVAEVEALLLASAKPYDDAASLANKVSNSMTKYRTRLGE